MNYLQIETRLLFSRVFLFVDTKDHGFEQIMENRRIRLRQVREFIKSDSPFRLILCKVRKKDVDSFCESLEQVRNKALLMGYRDYDDICEWLHECENRLKQTEEKAS